MDNVQNLKINLNIFVDTNNIYEDEMGMIEEIIKKIDCEYIEDKPKIMCKLQKYLEPIDLDYKKLSSLTYNAENKYFFDFNDKLLYVKAYIIRWDRYVDLHDHPDTGCIFKILYGKLRSMLYHKNLIYKDSITYYKGMIGYIDNDLGYHDMENLIIGSYSYSIHVYEKKYIPQFYKEYYSID